MTLGSVELARRARKSALSMCASSNAAHIGSSLSVIDILAVLYTGSVRIDPASINDPDRDVIVVSKGHAAAGVYAVLGHAGFFPLSWLDEYCVNGSSLGGHVTNGQVPGVEFSTGSLGHGLPFGVGVGLEMQMQKRKSQVFVVLSDGECDEGSNWEAALFASHHQLSNLVVLIDRNGLQSLTTTEKTLRLEPLAAKWQSFGWDAVEMDGHSHSEIGEALVNVRQASRPTVLICKTTKGKGVTFMEDQILWHYRSPDTEQLENAHSELDSQAI